MVPWLPPALFYLSGCSSMIQHSSVVAVLHRDNFQTPSQGSSLITVFLDTLEADFLRIVSVAAWKFHSPAAIFVWLLLHANISMKIFFMHKQNLLRIPITQKYLCAICVASREESGLSGLKAGFGSLNIPFFLGKL